MAVFIFQAKASSGKFVKGEVDAKTEAEARVKIRSQKLVPLKVIPKPTASKLNEKKALGGSVKPQELQDGTRNHEDP